MHPIIANATRLFAVVGAPYLPERHRENEAEAWLPQRTTRDIRTGSHDPAGSWLSGDR